MVSIKHLHHTNLIIEIPMNCHFGFGLPPEESIMEFLVIYVNFTHLWSNLLPHLSFQILLIFLFNEIYTCISVIQLCMKHTFTQIAKCWLLQCWPLPFTQTKGKISITLYMFIRGINFSGVINTFSTKNSHLRVFWNL